MLRHRPFQLAVVPMLLLVLVGCSGPDGETSPDVASDSTEDTADIIVCPDGLVLWPEYNVCEPQVDECEAWEVPVIGGGCMAVGPRACPKLWDPDADVDCEPGELMDYDGEPCPEGFVLTEDEVACIPFFEEDGVCGELEIPVLGGGCQRVGPDWGEGGEPYFDECGEGLLALKDGGCVMIGPRGCPKVWDPDADVGCEVGDVLPCPEGWIESEDGMYCHPGWDECPLGEVPLTGGGCKRLLPLAEDCPSGPFPEAPEGATDVLYVLADSLCTDGCGAEAIPYPSIQAAIDAASPDGAAVLVGPGTYDEGLVISRDISVVGLCSSLVELSGVVQLGGGSGEVSAAGLVIQAVSNVRVSGIRISSPATSVVVTDSKEVGLSELDILSYAGSGLHVSGESVVAVDKLYMHEPLPVDDVSWMQGQGVWVEEGATLTLMHSLIEGSRGTAIRSRHQKTELSLFDSVVRNTQSLSNGTMGYGLSASSGSTVSISACLFEGNREVAIEVMLSGTHVTIVDSVVRETQGGVDGKPGVALQVVQEGDVVISGCLFEENHGGGFIVAHDYTEVVISSSVIRRTLPSVDGESGWAIEVQQGCNLTLRGVLLDENTETGIAAYHQGTEVTMSGGVIRGTIPNTSGKGGAGIVALLGSSVLVDSSLLEANHSAGVYVLDENTDVSIENSVIQNTEASASEGLGYGVFAALGCSVSLVDCLIQDNLEAGVMVGSPGTSVSVSRCIIRRTMPDAYGQFGQGVVAQEGCMLSLAQSLLGGNTEAGLVVAHVGTWVDVVDSIVKEIGSVLSGVPEEDAGQAVRIARHA